STGEPSLAVRRYFLSQMSRDASWKGMASMSLGSIFTTVFINPRRSDVLTPYPNGSRGTPDETLWDSCEPRALPVPAAVCSTVRSLKPPPDRVTPGSLGGEHKILCRGQKPNDGPGGRQALQEDNVMSFLDIYIMMLQRYGPQLTR